MNTSAPVSHTFIVDVDDISVIPKIKSALKCFKGVVSVKSPAVRKESVSPSNDPWFDDPQNIKMILDAKAEARQDCGTQYTAEELRKMLGV
ncbi:MAG: hypothetical protein HUK04_06665 [Bacteroidaceae bacterium]|nr:hypothetical protein [Bacteroidaceae bacterium]